MSLKLNDCKILATILPHSVNGVEVPLMRHVKLTKDNINQVKQMECEHGVKFLYPDGSIIVEIINGKVNLLTNEKV